jgi:hypothetical protein
MYGRLASESEEQEQVISYQADALHARHISSEQYLDTTCGDAASEGPDASPAESGHGDRAAPPAVAEVPCLIETVPRSARNGAGVVQIKTSGTPRVPAAGPSTRRLPSTRFPTTSGRRLRSCCMQVRDVQLPKRPPGARCLLSRSDAGTLTVTLPPAGYAGIPSFGPEGLGTWFGSGWVSAAIRPALLWATTTFITCTASGFWSGFTGLAKFFTFPMSLLAVLVSDEVIHADDPYWDYYQVTSGLYAALLAVTLAVRALTTTTLSVGEFQWEYKESLTVAGVSLVPTCYRQGTTEELGISRDGDKIVLITGLTKVDFGRQNVGALSDEELYWVVYSVRKYQRQITAI